MAKYTFSQYDEMEKDKPQGSNKNFVGFFTLANDGDEAIVRFPYHSKEEVELCDVHSVQIGKSYRNVMCLRKSAKEPLENCPFCAADMQVRTRVFIKVVQYVKDENGQIHTEGKIFERSPKSDFVSQLKSMFDEYGDISDIIFKIKRKGAKGDMATTYSLVPANTAIYKPEVYVPDFSVFENFTLFKYFILNKDGVEMNEFLTTGAFPQPVKQEESEVPQSTVAPAPAVAQPQVQPAPQPYVAPQPQNYTQNRPSYGGAAVQRTVPNYGGAAPVNRPVRNYTYNK